MTGKSLAHYQVLDKLGAGGMGEVYRARDTRLGRDVAIKVLPAAFAQDAARMARFEREAQVLAALNHPNIGAIYGLEESDGQRFLVLEFVPGETLAGPLSPEDAWPIARQIIDALEEAHECGIVHRDLKPANIKITPDGKVKVLDFGLAKALTGDPIDEIASNSPTLAATALTRGAVLLGTAAYMSPEQARGKVVDKRSDIFAFGAVLYEMLTGRQAFSGETISDTLAAVLKNEPDWAVLPEATPFGIRTLLRHCLEKDAKRRLRDIGDARIVLDASEPQITTKTPGHQERPRFSLVSWCLGGGIAVLVLALAAVSFLHFRQSPPEARLSRFTIPAPEKAAFYHNPVISPDGRPVAFTATGQDGRRLLWVRSLDSLDARPLSGTEDAASPFWSPDSRFLAFSSGGKLKKVEVAGGPPQTLCDIGRLFVAGSWNRDGVILFSSGAFGGLLRVSSAGGAPAPVTSLESGKDRFHAWPHFLPDGRHFLYLASGAQPENSAIYVTSLDSPKDRKRLVGASHGAAYAPGHLLGHLLFLRERTLMAQPFDEKRLELAGDAFPVAEQVGAFRAAAFFSVSTNGVLVYRGGGGENTQLAWFDRAGKQLQTVGPPGDYVEVALSPDEMRVAVNRRDPQGSNRDLWLFEFARNTPSRFTFHEATDRLPVWSPDGARIAFSSPREGPESLYHKASSGAGSDELLLKSSGNRIMPTDWSRDGRYILYTSSDPKTNYDLWVLPLEGDRKPAPYIQTQFNDRHGQFSPDGKFISYISDESGRYEVYVQPFPPSGAKWMISSGSGSQPRWRRDGKEIFYVGPDRKLMSVEVKTAPKFDAAVPKALFETRMSPAVDVFRYAPSANGQRSLLNSVQEETASAPITLVQNWTAGLKR